MTSLNTILQDELRERQQRNPNFSQRAFARWLNVSPAQLSQIMSGKRVITPKMIKKISKKLGFSPDEEMNLLHASLNYDFLETTAKPKKKLLEEDTFRFISDWYHFAILSLTKVKGAKSDPRWVARRLGIKVSEAREGIDRLVRLGLLTTSPKFEQICEPLEVLSSVPSPAIRNFHKQQLLLATEKIDTVDISKREVQCITLAIDVRKIPQARRMISEALEKISNVLESDQADEVYSLSTQLFPLTSDQKEKK